ncbi:hypothetical protein EVB94_354 [Rhizobium phage RHph_TM40]|nr:hypothetical protein EVB94_354 [Rhizobium phage RHph_TM40]QIG72528.1 hypothetical protein EVB96_352 [Rhizobium phage RHph_TM3_3_6]
MSSKVRDSIEALRGSNSSIKDALATKAVASTVQSSLDAKASLTGSETLTNKTLSSPKIILTQSTSSLPTEEGVMEWDTDDNSIAVGDGTGTKVFRPNAWELIGSYSFTNVANFPITNLVAFKTLRITGDLALTSGGLGFIQLSSDNGSTFTTSGNHSLAYYGYSTAVVNGTSSTAVGYQMTVTTLANDPSLITATLTNLNKASTIKYMITHFTGLVTSSLHAGVTLASKSATLTGSQNAIRFIASAGNITGNIVLEGIRG